MKQNFRDKILAFLFFVLCCVFFPQTTVYAADLSSSSFIIKDPIIGTGGGYFSSATFGLFGSGDSVLTGYSTSTGFIGEYGFLYFPAGGVVVTPPTPTPTPTPGGGAGEVSPLYGICGQIADFNCDGEVNILDLSILLYYSDKSGEVILPYDLSPDGVIDLRDISIVFYYWDF